VVALVFGPRVATALVWGGFMEALRSKANRAGGGGEREGGAIPQITRAGWGSCTEYLAGWFEVNLADSFQTAYADEQLSAFPSNAVVPRRQGFIK